MAAQDIDTDRVAGVMLETYLGGNASFAPPEYIQKLRRWCDEHRALLIFDEVQAGFGRTGKYWGFEHYGVAPDLICCGKGISGGLPISAVIGRTDVMDFYPPGAMTSTHTGNPVCAAAVVANLRVIEEEGLVENARRMGEILLPELLRIGRRFPSTSARCMAAGWWRPCTSSSRAGSSPTPPRPRPSCGAASKGADVVCPGRLRRGVGENRPAADHRQKTPFATGCPPWRKPGGGDSMSSREPTGRSTV